MGLRRAFIRCLPTSTNRLRRAATRFACETIGDEEIRFIEQIPGCLSEEQGSLLAYLAAHPAGDGCIVEIGGFMGRSTLWLARGLRHAGGGSIFSIDPHDGAERPRVRTDIDSHRAFVENITRAGATDLVESIRERSQEVAKTWNRPIALLWIDGSHEYEDVLADLEGFGPHVIAGGHIALHDTRGHGFPGVRRAMLEYFARHPEFNRIVSLHNMTVYRQGY